MSTTDIIALLALVISLIGVIFAGLSAKAARDALAIARGATKVSMDIARRQNVIDLHNAWKPVHEIDPARLNAGHVRAAINALGLTASLWNHDVIEKEIIYQGYWDAFRDLFDTLNGLTALIPGYRKSPRDAISVEIRKAYEQMHARELDRVQQTSLGGAT